MITTEIATAEPTGAALAAEPVGFLRAALFQWMNPKGWLVAVGAAGTFLNAQPIWLGALFFAAAFPRGLVRLVLGALRRRCQGQCPHRAWLQCDHGRRAGMW